MTLSLGSVDQKDFRTKNLIVRVLADDSLRDKADRFGRSMDFRSESRRSFFNRLFTLPPQLKGRREMAEAEISKAMYESKEL